MQGREPFAISYNIKSKKALKLMLGCAMFVGCFGFAGGSSYAADYSVSDWAGLVTSDNYSSDGTTSITENITKTDKATGSFTLGNLTNTTIDGNSKTIDGNSSAYNFVYNSGVVGLTIQNLTYTNFSGNENRGVIYNNGTISAITGTDENSKPTMNFSNNSVSSSTTAYGGAIYNSGTISM